MSLTTPQSVVSKNGLETPEPVPSRSSVHDQTLYPSRARGLSDGPLESPPGVRAERGHQDCGRLECVPGRPADGRGEQERTYDKVGSLYDKGPLVRMRSGDTVTEGFKRK